MSHLNKPKSTGYGRGGTTFFIAGTEPVARDSEPPTTNPVVVEQSSHPSHWGFTSNNKNTALSTT